MTRVLRLFPALMDWWRARQQRKYDVARLMADGLVAKLELRPGKRYILLFDKSCLPITLANLMTTYIHEKWGIDALYVRAIGRPRDYVLGVEITEATDAP